MKAIKIVFIVIVMLTVDMIASLFLYLASAEFKEYDVPNPTSIALCFFAFILLVASLIVTVDRMIHVLRA